MHPIVLMTYLYWVTSICQVMWYMIHLSKLAWFLFAAMLSKCAPLMLKVCKNQYLVIILKQLHVLLPLVQALLHVLHESISFKWLVMFWQVSKVKVM